MGLNFYTAGKIWHADKFRFLRDVVGLPVKARWIDYTQDSDIVANRKGDLWQHCLEDVRDSDFLVLYSEDFQEEQRGALVEIGMAMAFNKPIYAIGKSKSISPNGISDVAFTHHNSWIWLQEINITKGAYMALASELGKQLKRKAA